LYATVVLDVPAYGDAVIESTHHRYFSKRAAISGRFRPTRPIPRSMAGLALLLQLDLVNQSKYTSSSLFILSGIDDAKQAFYRPLGTTRLSSEHEVDPAAGIRLRSLGSRDTLGI
jgi:hypothetical protein